MKAAGNPANSRSRWTLICRQLIRGYFADDGSQPVGEVDTSICLCPGVHARLENISAAGTWLTDESFSYNGRLTVRRKGEPVGAIMKGWRQLRAEQPELFRGILLWQSPTAFADSVIWSWQLAEEASRFRVSLRLVDALRTHWTDQALEQMWLTQSCQACIPPGCTPLCQVTDTGMAQPAKAAAKNEHDRLRSLMRQKARMTDRGSSYTVGFRECLLTVQKMHSCMEDLNRKSQTVLAEARAGGWLRYRPMGGQLRLADSQAWAACLTEGSSRMGPQFRELRDSHIQDGKPVAWKQESGGRNRGKTHE